MWDARPRSVGKSGKISFQRCTGERLTWTLPYTAPSTQPALQFRQHFIANAAAGLAAGAITPAVRTHTKPNTPIELASSRKAKRTAVQSKMQCLLALQILPPNCSLPCDSARHDDVVDPEQPKTARSDAVLLSPSACFVVPARPLAPQKNPSRKKGATPYGCGLFLAIKLNT